MFAIASFLAAVVLCIVIAVAIYFIAQIRSLKQSIDKLAPAAQEVSAIFPAIHRTSALIPDLIEKEGLVVRKLEELKNTFDEFLKFAIVSRGPVTETDNNSGFYHNTEEEAALREENEKARKLGVRIPGEAEAVFTIPKRQP